MKRRNWQGFVVKRSQVGMVSLPNLVEHRADFLLAVIAMQRTVFTVKEEEYAVQ
jgi:hypothetical protein